MSDLPVKVGPFTLRRVEQSTLPAGTVIRSDDGVTSYVKGKHGELRRVEPKLSKKERRARKGR